MCVYIYIYIHLSISLSLYIYIYIYIHIDMRRNAPQRILRAWPTCKGVSVERVSLLRLLRSTWGCMRGHTIHCSFHRIKQNGLRS